VTPSGFSVWTTASFDRSARKLAREHPDFTKRLETVVAVLSSDPYNRTCEHPIKKLADVKAGDGQYRMRVGRFRFRYDISGKRVDLKACGLRREDTY
jgi:hypothetical protein